MVVEAPRPQLSYSLACYVAGEVLKSVHTYSSLGHCSHFNCKSLMAELSHGPWQPSVQAESAGVTVTLPLLARADLFTELGRRPAIGSLVPTKDRTEGLGIRRKPTSAKWHLIP
ncbi:hypothetical protein SASPL_108688 [Salvia splendens]|uniref:Uncharacterized protein n=1 Tax=Salvia splendens TaxID=180675 RepID=A0A8X9A7P3_SALSN|nr:hypothetical protein SASPL_108688 [Salvia splendens]